MSRAQVDELLEMTLAHAKVVLSGHFAACEEPQHLSSASFTALFFCKALETAGFYTQPLLQFLAAQRPRFEELLLNSLRTRVSTILAEDRLEPLTVSSEREYDRSVLAFGLRNPAEEIARFPVVMPYSSAVPQLIRAAARFVSDYYRFSANLGEMDDDVRVCVDELAIGGELVGGYTHILDTQAQLHVSQVATFSINATYLERACTYLERLVERRSTARFPRRMRLRKSREAFRQVRMRCEDLLFEIVDTKVDSIMSLLSPSLWEPAHMQTDASGRAVPEPSQPVQDVVVFLENSLMYLRDMPDAVVKAIHFTSCRRVCLRLVESLEAHETRRFNLLGLIQLRCDVEFLESFALRTPVPNLIESFSEVRQLVDLFLLGPTAALLDPQERMEKYPHLVPHRMLALLEKFHDVGAATQSAAAGWLRGISGKDSSAPLPRGVQQIRRKDMQVIASKLKAELSG